MKRIAVWALGLGALGLAACSAAQDFFRNVTAADCSSPAAEQAFVANLPGIALIPPAQMQNAVAQVCIGLFGTVAAPTPAPGMSPALPAPTPAPAPSVAPSVVSTPAVAK